MSPPILLVALALVATMAAGCLDDQTPDSTQGSDSDAGGTASISRNVASGTTQNDNKPIPCDGDGHVSVSANVGQGHLHVTVTDGAGKTIHTFSLTGPGQGSDSDDITGTEGTWTLKARAEPRNEYGSNYFSGQYQIHLTC